MNEPIQNSSADSGDSKLPLQYEDGPDYCTVRDAQGRDFALTMQPDLMKAMERALSDDIAKIMRAPAQSAVEIQNAGNEAIVPDVSDQDVRWAVNYLLEQIAAKFEVWDTFDLFRSEAAATVRSFKHDLAAKPPAAPVETGHDAPQGYAASLKQMAQWLKDGSIESLSDIDEMELYGAADLIERQRERILALTAHQSCSAATGDAPRDWFGDLNERIGKGLNAPLEPSSGKVECQNCHNANKYGDYEGPTCDVCGGEGFISEAMEASSLYQHLYDHTQGYVVFRCGLNDKPIDRLEWARSHKQAIFVTEMAALDYCHYRNHGVDIHGDDQLPVYLTFPNPSNAVQFTDPQTAADTRLILADEYEAGLRKMVTSGYEEWQRPIQSHKLVIEALRFQARSEPQQSAGTASALAEELREYTAMKYAGDCKCGKCQLVPRALVERIYHTLNGTSLDDGTTDAGCGAAVITPWAVDNEPGRDFSLGLKSLSGLRTLTPEQSDFLHDAAEEFYRLRALPQSVGWCPIETAPKDGTVVMIWLPHSTKMVCAYFEGADKGWWVRHGAFCAENPSHWQPLPSSPLPRPQRPEDQS
jgi:hypothetical protein